MKHISLIFKKEWLAFVGSDKSSFILYLILVPSWGLLLGSWQNSQITLLPFLCAMFAVVLAANFSNTVFVTERVSGSLEILLTSGVSRNGILYGKLGFVFLLTVAIGMLCIAFSVLVRPLIVDDRVVGHLDLFSTVLLFATASFLNAASSAYFSVLLPNPRLLHFLNLFLVSFIMVIHMVLSAFFPIPIIAVGGLMLAVGVFFCLLAQREFNGERIIKPVIL